MEDIQQQVYIPLGRKTFLIFIMQRTGFPLLSFILTIVIIVSKGVFAGNNIVIKFGSIINWSAIVFFLLGIVTLAIGIITSYLEYSVSRIMFDNSSFHIVRGLLSKKEVVVPYRRIQSVEIKQPLFYRIMGVGHVVIATTTDLEQPNQAENETEEEVIPTIDYLLAKIVEKTLTDRAEIERIENVHN